MLRSTTALVSAASESDSILYTPSTRLAPVTSTLFVASSPSANWNVMVWSLNSVSSSVTRSSKGTVYEAGCRPVNAISGATGETLMLMVIVFLASPASSMTV